MLYSALSPEFHVAQIGLADVAARLRDHILGRHVDADHGARLADLARREKGVESRAAAQIKHPFARLQFSDRRGFPQPRPESAPSAAPLAFLI